MQIKDVGGKLQLSDFKIKPIKSSHFYAPAKT